MNWKNCDWVSQNEETTETNDPKNVSCCQAIYDENERKKVLQLSKLQDPTTDESRKTFIALSSRFGELLVNDSLEEITQTLMTPECETFLFNFAEVTPLVYTTKPEGFIALYKDYQVVKRQVKENCVDVEKRTAFQFCYCEIMNKNDQSIIRQFSCEIFSFEGDKISKYRASHGCSTSFNENHHPFLFSKKDLKLAKVKELNYAWAGQPDLERVASLLHSTTEYKIWRWKDMKSITLYKKDFPSDFKNLQESYELKCVVPYEVYSEGEFVIGTYVYHLEGKNDKMGQKYIWLNTCIYAFDKELNFTKINHHGELYSENKEKIPFDVYSRERLQEKLMELYPSAEIVQNDEYLLTTNQFVFSFEASGFAPRDMFEVDYVKGFGDYINIMRTARNRNKGFKWSKPVDIYVDHYDPSYDVMITIDCVRVKFKKEGYKYSGVEMNLYSLKKFSFENGKIAKVVSFPCEVIEMIPSPYDDPDFSAENIQCKEKILS